MGKVRIAQTLARAGLHLGATTVGRMLKGGEETADLSPVGPSCREGLSETPSVENVAAGDEPGLSGRGDRPVGVLAGHGAGGHAQQSDGMLSSGMSWMPFSLAQSWPFCWWVAIVVDHFSRRVMGFAAFKQQPTSEAVRAFLGLRAGEIIDTLAIKIVDGRFRCQ